MRFIGVWLHKYYGLKSKFGRLSAHSPARQQLRSRQPTNAPRNGSRRENQVILCPSLENSHLLSIAYRTQNIDRQGGEFLISPRLGDVYVFQAQKLGCAIGSVKGNVGTGLVGKFWTRIFF